MCLRGGVMVPKWDAEYSASISLLQQTSSGLVRKPAMQKPSGVSQINLSSTREKATRVFAQQTFGQLCIPNKSLAILSDISQPDKKTRKGDQKRRERALGYVMIILRTGFCSPVHRYGPCSVAQGIFSHILLFCLLMSWHRAMSNGRRQRETLK